MPIIHPYDKIMKRVRGITTDKNGIFWDDPTLIDYIDEGQEEFCQSTKALKAEAPLTMRENCHIYTLPDDCYLATRVERSDGTPLIKTSSVDLSREFGENFRDAVGEPTHYYQDLDGEMQLRFYPKPSTDPRAAYQEFDQDEGVVVDTGVDETPFDQEEGAVIDYEDNTCETYNIFDHEEGGVTSVVVNEDKFIVFYVRNPRPEILEISDIQALQYYALHKCYESDSAFQDFAKSEHFERKFHERIGRERGRVESSYNGNLSVNGSYA
jgi:hypothetical protein